MITYVAGEVDYSLFFTRLRRSFQALRRGSVKALVREMPPVTRATPFIANESKSSMLELSDAELNGRRYENENCLNRIEKLVSTFLNIYI